MRLELQHLLSLSFVAAVDHVRSNCISEGTREPLALTESKATEENDVDSCFGLTALPDGQLVSAFARDLQVR